MALQRDARYPGRWTAASGGHPQGAFKNRSAPGALDGSYIEQDWANDWDGYFSSLLGSAGLVANGTVDAVGASQYFTAFQTILQRTSPIIGGLNIKAAQVTAAATLTLTADELVVKTALGGTPYILSSFSKVLNTATTGLNGMDTGLAPTSGFIAVYAIYNPVSGVSGVLATVISSAIVPEVYGGANIPSGFTASALISCWPTNASRLLIVARQKDRRVAMPLTTTLSTGTATTTPTAFFTGSAIPANTKEVEFVVNAGETSAGVGVQLVITADAGGTDATVATAITSAGTSSATARGKAQVSVSSNLMYYMTNTNAGTYSVQVVSYTF